MSGISQNLSSKQLQSLVMTPQLQQSLKMLELSTHDLVEFVEQEIEKNPLLEKKEEGASDDRTEPQDDRSEVSDGDASSLDAFEQSKESSDASEALDADYENLWDAKSAADAPVTDFSAKGTEFDKMYLLEQTVAEEESLEDHINEQIMLAFSTSSERLIAEQLLFGLDNRGYFEGDIRAVAKELGCEAALVERVLSECQLFSPSGIFARSLAECFEIQLRERNRFDPMMKTLLQNLSLIEQAELGRLEKKCGVNSVELKEMIEEIRTLTPYPALNDFHDNAQNISADIILSKNDEGDWTLELNADALPRVLVNNDYYATIKKTTKDKEEIQYVAEQMQTANWLIKALQQRQETILKVASQIVADQSDFLEKGVMYLKPMTLAMIAEKIEMHESTVGRVTMNKYIATPRGLFELKYFFSAGVQNILGEQTVSNKSVKHKIQDMIDKETHETILSDDKIAELLKNEGIDIARRTVAKYRESLGIASSSKRRKQKKLEFSL